MCFTNQALTLITRDHATRITHQNSDWATDSHETYDLWDTVELDPNLDLVEIVLDPDTTESLPICVSPGEKQTVGRSRSVADHCVEGDKRMSRQHFSITCESGVGKLRDLNSTNGTLVNGRRVSEARVYEGDRVMAGSATFTVRYRTA